jgi:hypothetical protein
MHRVKSSVSLGLAAVGLAMLAPPGTALADPTKSEFFTVTCNNGARYEVTTAPGSGAFTPAFDVDSNTVLIPVVFDGFTGMALDEEGEVVAEFADPTREVKGSGKQRGLTRCQARFEETVTLTQDEALAEGLPGAGTYTFIGSGDVLAQIRGR